MAVSGDFNQESVFFTNKRAVGHVALAVNMRIGFFNILRSFEFRLLSRIAFSLTRSQDR